MHQSSSFFVVSCEELCCLNTRRIEQVLAQFGVTFQRVRYFTPEAAALRGAADTAMFHGKSVSSCLLSLFVIDDGEGRVLWEGGRPSELEIARAVYLAGNYA